MLSSPVNTLEQRATIIGLFARFQSNDPLHVDAPQYAPLHPLRQIVTVRGNRISRRRSVLSMVDPAPAGSSANVVEAGRGWRRGAAWDAIDRRSISERLNAAVAGGTDAMCADRYAVIEDAVLDMSAITDAGAGAGAAGREVPVLV
jgi:hypothetical protein